MFDPFFMPSVILVNHHKIWQASGIISLISSFLLSDLQNSLSERFWCPFMKGFPALSLSHPVSSNLSNQPSYLLSQAEEHQSKLTPRRQQG